MQSIILPDSYISNAEKLHRMVAEIFESAGAVVAFCATIGMDDRLGVSALYIVVFIRGF